MTKASLLRGMLESNELQFIMEAHNGLSAKIVEEAGFRGIWASGLSMSASLGVRDNNEASWTQVLEILEFMSDATSIPILVDGDTGYGNFNNARRLVRKLEQRGIAGVCVEDKLFPKTNSFISGESQPLADVGEFCGKVSAMKDAQLDPDFVVVARVEAFIAGWGLDEALRRAEAYRKAGADAVLIHSKRPDYSEIAAFMKEWGDRLPVVIVPTKYYSTPTEVIRSSGVRLVIWANHNLRSAINAMKETSARIFKEQSLVGIEDKVATVSEVFRLQGEAELEEAEKLYLPTAGKSVNAVVLAAARGERLGELTSELPKAMLEVNGRPILAQTVDKLNRVGIKDICAVRGYRKDKVALTNLKYVDNDEYATTSEVYSLYLARACLGGNTVVVYGDIIFKSYFLNDLLNDDSPATIIVDADAIRDGSYRDYVSCDRYDDRAVFDHPARLLRMSHELAEKETCGEFVGILKLNSEGSTAVLGILDEAAKSGIVKTMRMDELLTRLAAAVPVAVKYVRGSWIDVNGLVDLMKAQAGGREERA